MSDRGIAQLLSFLRRRTAPTPDLVPDGELLHRYTTTRDEAAFELLVRRHGPMVLGVARRVLRESHAAEDVFQAAFLTLARKAKSLRQKSALAGWLYRVTLRIALRAKQSSFSARSIVSIAPSQIPVSVDESATVEWGELRQTLDEEVNKLPDRFRMAVVLCYLSGKSTEDAAKELGCPRGTILSRLASARQRLRRSLTRRGYAIPSTILATGLASETAPAALTANLIALAMHVIQPAAVVAPAVASLSYGVIHAMIMTKVKVALCLVLVSSAVGIGVGQLGGPGPATADEKPVVTKAKAPEQVEQTEESRRRSEDMLLAIEQNLIKHLEISSKRRIKAKISIMEIEDNIDEIRQNMAPLTKVLDHYLTNQLNASMVLHDMKRAGKSDEEIKRQQASFEYINVSIDEVRQKLQRHRVEMRHLRRQLLETEEELSLQEKLANIEMDRISRAMKR